MNTPITFTPMQVWTTVLAIAGAIVSISAAVSVILKFVQKAREPEVEQNKRIDALEKTIDGLKVTLEEHKRYLETDKRRLDTIEFGNEATNEALLALLKHAINGNDVDSLKEAQRKLEGYLVTRRVERD